MTWSYNKSHLYTIESFVFTEENHNPLLAAQEYNVCTPFRFGLNIVYFQRKWIRQAKMRHKPYPTSPIQQALSSHLDLSHKEKNHTLQTIHAQQYNLIHPFFFYSKTLTTNGQTTTKVWFGFCCSMTPGLSKDIWCHV